ncbi:MAG: iron-sulfur cluster assembly protein [Pseudonocardia sp.]|jgi:metal-sulfur cluster biosynthetic enzyme
MTVLDRVRAALDTVRDPELDEAITSLDFVASCTVTGEAPEATAEVHLRLPTYFCAPNFAFLMVADAYDAVASVPGVAHARIVLDDHFASDTINEGVAARAGFVDTFGSQAQNELDELRALFLRKAVLAGQDLVARPLRSAGHTLEQLAGMTLGDTPPSPELDRLRDRRRELGLGAGDGDPLLVDGDGNPVTVEALPMHLRRAQTTRVGIEANAGQCRSLLADRYGLAHTEVSTS